MTLRLFVALHPPADIVRSMLDALGSLDLPDHRTVPPEQVHMTLQFVGDTSVRDLDGVIESVERSVAGVKAFALAPERLIGLPERGACRLVAATTDAPAPLLEIQSRLATRLAGNVRRRPGDRFLPHLTLCRFRPPLRTPIDGAALDPAAFPVDAIRLMRSTLHPDGARHVEIARAPLGA